MKEYKYTGFDEPIIVDDTGKITYRGREVEKYFHGYNAIGMAAGFSASALAKAHYISEMRRIDTEIEREEYKKSHADEFETIESAEESLQYFFGIIS